MQAAFHDPPTFEHWLPHRGRRVVLYANVFFCVHRHRGTGIVLLPKKKTRCSHGSGVVGVGTGRDGIIANRKIGPSSKEWAGLVHAGRSSPHQSFPLSAFIFAISRALTIPPPEAIIKSKTNRSTQQRHRYFEANNFDPTNIPGKHGVT